MIIYRTVAAGSIDSSGLQQLMFSLAVDTGVEVQGWICSGSQDIDGDSDPATDRLTIDFDGAPEEATIDATIAAFNPLTVGEIRKEDVDIRGLVMTPPSNSWTDVPGAEWTVEKSRMVDGDLRISMILGKASSSSPRAAGETIDFTAGRNDAGSLVLEDDDNRWGNAPGLRVEIYAPASDTLRLRFRRFGPTTVNIRVSGTIERSILP